MKNTWNKKKKTINELVFLHYVHEREVWWSSIGVNIGFEEDGKNEQFERPVLVLKKFNREVVLIVPLSSKVKKGKYYINFTHKDIQFCALISQIRLISTKRLLRRMYTMSEREYGEIRNAVRSML